MRDTIGMCLIACACVQQDAKKPTATRSSSLGKAVGLNSSSYAAVVEVRACAGVRACQRVQHCTRVRRMAPQRVPASRAPRSPSLPAQPSA
jgi:hypothetical protein